MWGPTGMGGIWLVVCGNGGTPQRMVAAEGKDWGCGGVLMVSSICKMHLMDTCVTWGANGSKARCGWKG